MGNDKYNSIWNVKYRTDSKYRMKKQQYAHWRYQLKKEEGKYTILSSVRKRINDRVKLQATDMNRELASILVMNLIDKIYTDENSWDFRTLDKIKTAKDTGNTYIMCNALDGIIDFCSNMKKYIKK